MKYLALLTLFIFSSCALFKGGSSGKKESTVDITEYQPVTTEDYIDHLIAFEGFYLNSPDIKLFKLNKKENRYLESLAEEILKNNELFFTQTERPIFRVVESEVPFHFSLPGKRIFFSSGLVAKYIKSEKLLYSVLAYELIRSEKNIYRKVRIIPTGYMSTSRILSLLRLSTSEKVETHKWAYYTLKRVGVDPDIYLSWLQIQNRNSADFSLLLGDTSSISREESLFKAFIIENAKKKSSLSKYERSSREFYAFVNRIKG